MAKVTVITREGEQKSIAADPGRSLMEALRDGGIDEIQGMCGGCCSCCTCHVYIEAAPADALPAMSEMENDLLSCSDARNESSRLSCQIPVTEALEGMRLRVAPET